MGRRARAAGWSSSTPLVVGERPIEAHYYDQRPARTWVPRRRWFRVPEGPWPCGVCSQYLQTGAQVHRGIVGGEPVYRHPDCDQVPGAPSRV